jgi:MarR family transcriptional regulator, transcriptional regulator for hemolysin
MLQYDFDQSVGYWITMANQSIRRVLSQRLMEQEVTLRQWEVLVWLARDPELSQSQLAECMGIEPPTLAGVVNRMERDGWIEKTNCEDDRRRCKLHPTAKAEAIWNRSVTLAHEVRAQAIAGISPEDLDALRRVCDTIRGNLNQVPPLPESEPCHDVDPAAVRRDMKVLKAM